MRTASHSQGDKARNNRVSSRFYAPPADLEGCFTSFYRMELDSSSLEPVTDYLHPEWANIRFFSGSLPVSQMPGKPAVSDACFTATGPSSLCNKFQLGPTQMWGVGFLPLGWARFFDVDADTMANVAADGEKHPAFAKFVPLVDVLCDPALDHDRQYEVLSETLRGLAKPSRDEDRILSINNGLLDHDLSHVSELAEAANINVRMLERICGRYFGFAPKLLLRRQRMMRSLTTFLLDHDGNWSDAIDENYHDQAHFTREFRSFMNMKPSEYAAIEHPVLASFIEARARIWGSAAQTLDIPGAAHDS